METSVQKKESRASTVIVSIILKASNMPWAQAPKAKTSIKMLLIKLATVVVFISCMLFSLTGGRCQRALTW